MNPALLIMAKAATAGGGSGPPVAGYTAWYDATIAGDFTFSSGSIVSQWNDKSGNGRHLAQSDTSKQPSRTGTINGLTAVAFDGSNDVLHCADFQDMPFTWFIVAYKATDAATGSNSDVLIRIDQHATYRGTSTSFNSWTGSSEILWSTTSTDWTDDHVYCQVAATGSNNTKSYIDGTLKATGTFTNAAGDGLMIGADNTTGTSAPGDWVVGEIIIYGTALSDADRGTTEDYLSAKWGTP